MSGSIRPGRERRAALVRSLFVSVCGDLRWQLAGPETQSRLAVAFSRHRVDLKLPGIDLRAWFDRSPQLRTEVVLHDPWSAEQARRLRGALQRAEGLAAAFLLDRWTMLEASCARSSPVRVARPGRRVPAWPAARGIRATRAAEQPRTASEVSDVLVVEDDSRVRVGLEWLLRLEGFEVATAADGAEALRHLADTHRAPRVIVLDLVMPGIDGWELRNRLKADPRLCEIPIIVVTGRSDAEQAARDLGVSACFRKPVDPIALVAAVAAATLDPDARRL